MTAQIVRQERRENTFDHLQRGADTKGSDLPALECTRSLAKRGGVRQQAASAAKEVISLRCQLDAPADSVEKGDAQIGFECEYLPGRSRLAQV